MDETGRADRVAQKEYTEVLDILKRADRSEMEFARQIVDAFPHGKDPFVNCSWIIHAIDCGPPEAVAWMIEKDVALNVRDSDGGTVMHACLDRSVNDSYEVLEMLISAGADLNLRGSNDWTPLHKAAVDGDLKALRMLLDAGADPSVRTRIDDYATPEEEARILGRLKSAEFLAAHMSKR